MSIATLFTPAAATAETPSPEQQVSDTAQPQDTRIYRGRTVEELLPRIQAELGADAVVIRREKGLTGGFAGFFQRPFVEIEARRGTPGVDCYDEDGAPALPEPPAFSPPPPDDPAADQEQQFRDLLPAIVQDDDPFAAALAEAQAAVTRAPAPLTDEPTTSTPTAAVFGLDPRALPRPASAARGAPAGRTRATLDRILTEAGMSEGFVDELIGLATAHVLPLMPGRPSLARAVHAALAQQIPSCRPLPAAGATIAVVGAGGSGKSSCCAALLDAYRKRSTLPAGCAAIPLDPSQAERQALREARNRNPATLLLLDTPSVSPADPGSIRALAGLLQELRADRVVLALPATLGATPAAQLLEALRPLSVTALAITHADETDQLGVAAQIACTFGVAPIYWVGGPTRGRSHPGLTALDPANLADRLLPPR